MTDEKIYTPTEITDTPFPGAAQESFTTTNSSTGGVNTQGEIKGNNFPQKRIAVELISAGINTKSKKILQEFELVESGGIVVGKYEEGVSGDVKITPVGVVARNTQGESTFALDGATGDAIFRGTVQAGSVLSGEIVLGGNANAEGALHVLDNTGLEKVLVDKDGILVSSGKIIIKDDTNTNVLDAKGLVAGTSFTTDSSGTIDLTVDTTTSATPTEIPSIQMTGFVITRPRMLLTTLTIEAKISDAAQTGTIRIYVGGDVDDVQETRITVTNTTWMTHTTVNLREISANSPPTTYILSAIADVTGGATLSIRNRALQRMTFGV